MSVTQRPRLGILLSGAGSTYGNLVRVLAAQQADPAAPEIVVVVASRAEAGGLAMARAHGHATAVARSAEEVTAALTMHRAEWVAMCGWMHFYDPPPCFQGRTLNVHPSLLPAFGGTGMYGARVHAAVLASGCTLSGCTVHLVTGAYDSGPILAQQAVPVLEHDTVASLQERVQAAERELYPRVIVAAAAGRVRRRGAGFWLAGPDA